nr:hypothetical protein [Lamprobacter sp.]
MFGQPAPIGVIGEAWGVECHQGGALVEIGRGRSGRQGECLAIGRDGGVEIALLLQESAKVAVQQGALGVEGDGLAQAGDGRLELAVFLQGGGEIIECRHMLGGKADGLAELRDGLTQRARLACGTPGLKGARTRARRGRVARQRAGCGGG